MAADRRTHRSHVSYIDKSRNYYGAQGYPQAYQWSYNHDVPFTPLTKPLNECRIGLVTTSFFERKAVKNRNEVPAAPTSIILFFNFNAFCKRIVSSEFERFLILNFSSQSACIINNRFEILLEYGKSISQLTSFVG